jgi:C4-dicarboxylate-specific signal transduction histidine kinase
MTASATYAETHLTDELLSLREQVAVLATRVTAGEQRRRAMLHIMADLTETNRKLSDQRKAMLHILVDYESDRKDLAKQTERLDNSRRALMHILGDSHKTNLRLGLSRKAMIHIMDDLRQTTEDIRVREQELREKQEQLVQAAKLATLGELTTGVAHELNNPLNNIGLHIGNVLDMLQTPPFDADRVEQNLTSAAGQVAKATEIISHLRKFGRAAPASRELISVNTVIATSLSLLQEQFRLREIDVVLNLTEQDPQVLGSPIQLEQVYMNLLTNAQDAVKNVQVKRISIETAINGQVVTVSIKDTGSGIPAGFEQRVFDPFFTTKDVGEGTGLGLSIVYGIVKDHEGRISVQPNAGGPGAEFIVELPIFSRSEAAQA